ncbi:protein FAR-RED IMPAIRED RESPONSE 1-like [Zingiber officinale]|uniref:protein FAR-RED IMPAIRED RESPONSE 1-like n=1 Tax=Zingiber officinale TaxID=94328 RepID=UPI001C4B9DB5|nr:protein FAR-RED IMPAIRED RESPONSE 1-like [Zingiber officinale]
MFPRELYSVPFSLLLHHQRSPISLLLHHQRSPISLSPFSATTSEALSPFSATTSEALSPFLPSPPPPAKLQAPPPRSGGYENLSFDERKCRNYVAEARRLRLGNGDAEALNNYFCRMQSRNSNFFYVIDVDEDSRIRNIFWADARCRAACDSFSDVVTFDTTYLTNSYDMPFAPFVGVNHHGESILLGCGLISKEDSETFIWLFKSWLACMRGRAPRAIITDQCKAMEIAILEVFPDSHHRLCLWHIMKKLPAKFSSHANYKLIKRNLKNIVYNSLTSTECDSNWKKFIKEFNLEKNDWLNSLYEIRHKWMPVYVKDKFWARMSTSQRSESMNAFFDDYVHSKITLKQFVEQYNNALKSKIEKEDNSDFASFNLIIPVISGNPIEKQFQSVYTNKIFKLFQNELRGLMFCNTLFVKEEGSTLFFEVMETVYGKDGTTPKEISFWVKRKVTTVPEHYILERWRKDIKCGYQGITNIYDDSCQHAEERRRYNNLQPLLQEVGQLGSKNDESNIIHEESRNESKKFHSPLKVRSRGRPPTKRKQSKLEQIEKRAKAKSRKKGSTIDRKQDELSNIEQIDKFSESQRLFRLDKELLVLNDIIQTMERTRSFEKPIDLLQMHTDLFKVSSLIQEDTNDGLMVDAHDSLFVPRRRECKDEF